MNYNKLKQGKSYLPKVENLCKQIGKKYIIVFSDGNCQIQYLKKEIYQLQNKLQELKSEIKFLKQKIQEKDKEKRKKLNKLQKDKVKKAYIYDILGDYIKEIQEIRKKLESKELIYTKILQNIKFYKEELLFLEGNYDK